MKENTGIIKTIYSDGKRRLKTTNRKIFEAICPTSMINEHEPLKEPIAVEPILDINVQDNKCKLDQNIVSLVKSDTDLDRNRLIEVITIKSSTSINQQQYNILNYMFREDSKGRLGNQVYCVGYFTVENNFAKSPATSQSSPGSGKSNISIKEIKVRLCDSQCASRTADETTCSQSVFSLDFPDETADLITVTKCKQIECDNKKDKEPESPDERMLLDLTSLNKECCDVAQTVEQVTGGMTAKMKYKEHDCYCSCDCTFGFVKKTTYCGICGGFEKPGSDFSRKPPIVPFPCPIFHKLVDKIKLSSSSDIKKKADESQKNMKTGTKSIGSAKSDKNAEFEKDNKKGKKKMKDERFQFNYGFTGIRTYLFILRVPYQTRKKASV